ncbi:hypothetical protein P4571_08350 [Niallia alba]|uniref:hypothetical protein n=1 Tax=Niallia alba TaxID=2729105 RepID=UPI002E220BBB|nr:hypothetical protein [Niallia alba]
MDKLLGFFKENKVPIQITIDIDKNPTVHAFYEVEGKMELYKTVGESVESALLNMKSKLFV